MFCTVVVLKPALTVYVICNCLFDDTTLDPIVQPNIVCGVGSAHRRATYKNKKEILVSTFNLVEHKGSWR